MRILHTIRSVNPEGGGVIETVKQFSRALEGQGHDVTIASLDARMDRWVSECPHAVVALGRGNDDSGAGVPPANCPSGVSPEEAMAGERPAVPSHRAWLA